MKPQFIKGPRDFNPPQLTETQKAMMRLQSHLEGITLNLATQIRAICMTVKIDPTEFVKNFHDQIGQAEFLSLYKEAEKQLIKEYEDKMKNTQSANINNLEQTNEENNVEGKN